MYSNKQILRVSENYIFFQFKYYIRLTLQQPFSIFTRILTHFTGQSYTVYRLGWLGILYHKRLEYMFICYHVEDERLVQQGNVDYSCS